MCLGKHSVILNATSYKDWADDSNSVMVEPNGKTDAADGVFFKKGGFFNQGEIFTFDEDEFIAGCEKAVERYKSETSKQRGHDPSK